MIGLHFLTKETIVLGLENFAVALSDKYEVRAIPLFELASGDKFRFGYILYDERRKRNKKVYQEFAQHPEENSYGQLFPTWFIEENGGISFSNQKETLGDAMDRLSIQEREKN